MKTRETSKSPSPRKGGRKKTSHPGITPLGAVARAENGASLIDFLAAHLHVSKKRAKALLDSRSVFVNRSRVWMARHRLAAGDSVEIAEHVVPSPGGSQPGILYEDSHYLIVNKPAGLLSNGRNSMESTLGERLGDDSVRAVHRLDRDTTGCLWFARSIAARDAAVALFRSRAITKRYHAVTRGRFPHAAQAVDQPLDGRRAVTRLERLDANRSASHLRLRLITGRLHQVRRHLAQLGYPLIGDRKYGRGARETPRSMEVTRQMLHASTLAFEHPFTGKQIRVRAPLPRDFRACLSAFSLK